MLRSSLKLNQDLACCWRKEDTLENIEVMVQSTLVEDTNLQSVKLVHSLNGTLGFPININFQTAASTNTAFYHLQLTRELLYPGKK